MPKGSKVARCVDDVMADGKSKVPAIKICQASTGDSYRTGKKAKNEHTMNDIYDRTLALLGEDKPLRSAGEVKPEDVGDQFDPETGEPISQRLTHSPGAKKTGIDKGPLTAADKKSLKKADTPMRGMRKLALQKLFKSSGPKTSLGAKLTKGIHPARNTLFGLAKGASKIGKAVSDTVKSAKKKSGHVTTKKKSEEQNDSTEYTNMNNTYARMTVLVEAQMEENILGDMRRAATRRVIRRGSHAVGRTPVLGTAISKTVGRVKAAHAGYKKFASRMKAAGDVSKRHAARTGWKAGRAGRAVDKVDAKIKRTLSDEPGTPSTSTPTTYKRISTTGLQPGAASWRAGANPAQASVADRLAILAKRREGGGAAGVGRAIHHVRGQQGSNTDAPAAAVPATAKKKITYVGPSKGKDAFGRPKSSAVAPDRSPTGDPDAERGSGFPQRNAYTAFKKPLSSLAARAKGAGRQIAKGVSQEVASARLRKAGAEPDADETGHVKTKGGVYVKADSTIYARIGDLLGEKVASTSDFTSQGFTPMAARMRRKMMGPQGPGGESKRKQAQTFGTSLPQGGRTNTQV